MTIFEKRRNFGLCNRSFTEKPYCNQVGALLNPNHRFCDVCNKSWLFKGGLIVDTTRTVYKSEDIEEGSLWFREPNIVVKILEISKFSAKYVCKDGDVSLSSLENFQSYHRPIVPDCYLADSLGELFEQAIYLKMRKEDA